MNTTNNYQLIKQGADLYKSLNDLCITNTEFNSLMKGLFVKSTYIEFCNFDYECYNLSFTRNY